MFLTDHEFSFNFARRRVRGASGSVAVQTVEVVAKVVVSKSAVWPWLVRFAWVAVGVCAQRSLANAVENLSPGAATVVQIAGVALWITGALWVAIPSVTALTAARTIIPTSIVAAIPLLVADGLNDGWAIATIAVSIVATVVVFNADLGQSYVQASAYGEEDRHLLRPPAPYLIATVATWSVWAGAGVGAVVAVAHQRWWIGGILGALSIATVVWGWQRWHRLSRRWLVFVPVGVVLHDHLVLAETWMIRRQELVGLRLAPADTGAADLTGPATGHAVEILLADTLTVVLAGSRSAPNGKAIHLTAALVAPSRPGAALRQAATRRLVATSS